MNKKYLFLIFILLIWAMYFLHNNYNNLKAIYYLKPMFYDTTTLNDTFIVKSKTLCGTKEIDTMVWNTLSGGFRHGKQIASCRYDKKGRQIGYVIFKNDQIFASKWWDTAGKLRTWMQTVNKSSGRYDTTFYNYYSADSQLSNYSIRICDSNGIILSDKHYDKNGKERTYKTIGTTELKWF